MTIFSIAPLRSSLIAVTVSFAYCLAASAADPSLRFEKVDAGPIIVVATNAPLNSQLSLHLVDPESDKVGPAMLCDLHSKGDGWLTLKPRFDLAADSTYRAQLKSGDELITELDWKTAESGAPTPRVNAISPSSEKLPANLLKFYITFSEPMRGGRDIFDHFHIHDEAGKRVESPWRQQELWSDDHRTLTLWIHPGRVKQGVNLRTTMGPVLLPDRRYSLIVESGLLSLPGKPTIVISRKKFSTSAEDHERPSAKTWGLGLPKIGSKDSLWIEFPKPLDQMLSSRYLMINSENGTRFPTQPYTWESMEGVKNHGTMIVLRPAQPWRNETYTLHAGEFLEDLAGNTPTRVFDTDLENPIREATEADLKVSFRPLPSVK